MIFSKKRIKQPIIIILIIYIGFSLFNNNNNNNIRETLDNAKKKLDDTNKGNQTDDYTGVSKGYATYGNNGTVSCNTYCSTGWNYEGNQGSKCLAAFTGSSKKKVDCDHITYGSEGLVCCCMV